MKIHKAGKRFVAEAYHWLVRMGWDARQTLYSLAGAFPAFREYREIKRQNAADPSPWRIVFNPCLSDRFMPSGQILKHYFYQDLHVAQRIFQNRPERHVDFGSSISGFVSHVASFRPIEVFDVRPLSLDVSNIAFKQCDLMNVPTPLYDCTDSLSCLHVLEHLGLGRYGDTVDFYGHKKGFDGLHRLLKTGGRLYLSVPIGPERIEFNAHRVFSLRTILDLFRPAFSLEEFSYIDDENRFFQNISLDEIRIQRNLDVDFGCGIFELIKR